MRGDALAPPFVTRFFRGTFLFVTTTSSLAISCGSRKPNLRPPHKPRPYPIRTIPQLDAAAASRLRSSASARNQSSSGESFGQPRSAQKK